MARSGARTSTARIRRRLCPARPIRSGSRSTRRPARSTGPTSAPVATGLVRSGVRAWTARQSDPSGPKHCWRGRSGRSGRYRARSRGQQALPGQLRRLHDLELEPHRRATRTAGQLRRRFRKLPRPAEGACEPTRRSPAEPRSARNSAAATNFAPELLGAFLYRAPASVAYTWTKDGSSIATGATFTPTQCRQLHVHRDGRQPGRNYGGNQRGEAGQGQVSQGQQAVTARGGPRKCGEADISRRAAWKRGPSSLISSE